MTVSHAAEDRILGGERRTDGLWVHRGKLSVGPPGGGTSPFTAPFGAGDLNVSRGGGTGVVYFGGRADTYLYFDGTSFKLAGGTLKSTTDTGWITPAYVNGWAAYGDGSGGFGGSVGYRKMPDGQVIVRGLVASGAQNATIFSLPVGYRPVANSMFSCANAGGVCRISVYPAGTVQHEGILAGTFSASWQSINEIRFLAEL